MKITAILDTNVFISGCFGRVLPTRFSKRGKNSAFGLRYQGPFCRSTIGSSTNLPKGVKFRLSPPFSESSSFTRRLVEPVSCAEPVCSDPDDDKFLAAAIAAGADYVVSGDKALLNLKSHHGVEIIRPSRFLKLLCG